MYYTNSHRRMPKRTETSIVKPKLKPKSSKIDLKPEIQDDSLLFIFSSPGNTNRLTYCSPTTTTTTTTTTISSPSSSSSTLPSSSSSSLVRKPMTRTMTLLEPLPNHEKTQITISQNRVTQKPIIPQTNRNNKKTRHRRASLSSSSTDDDDDDNDDDDYNPKTNVVDEKKGRKHKRKIDHVESKKEIDDGDDINTTVEDSNASIEFYKNLDDGSYYGEWEHFPSTFYDDDNDNLDYYDTLHLRNGDSDPFDNFKLFDDDDDDDRKTRDDSKRFKTRAPIGNDVDSLSKKRQHLSSRICISCRLEPKIPMMCSACKKFTYCNVSCQKKHWVLGNHRRTCCK